MRTKPVLLLIGSLLVLTPVLAWARLRPSQDLSWRTEQAVLPHVVFEDSLVHVQHVRNFTYRSADAFTPRYETRTYNVNRIERVWFVLSPFNPDWRGPAHSFLSFSTSDSQFVSISVEARREVGEEYSVWKGLGRQYELMFVIGAEQDLIGLRAVTWNDPVYLYPMNATPEQARALFVHMLGRARKLEQEPEFYNTLTNNCTTNILDAVNQVATKKIPYGPDVLLPGYSDELAHELGLIDTDLPLEQARARFRINERARHALGAPDFSLRIRAQ